MFIHLYINIFYQYLIINHIFFLMMNSLEVVYNPIIYVYLSKLNIYQEMLVNNDYIKIINDMNGFINNMMIINYMMWIMKIFIRKGVIVVIKLK